MNRVAIPDVVVLLPGITGSVLAKDGREIWSPRPGAVLNSLLRFRRTMEHLELEDDDPTASDLGDGVTATRLVDAVHIVPGLWKIDVYDEIEKRLLTTFDLTLGINYFPFPYDWRRDNRAAAHRLRAESRRWLDGWRTRSGNDEARLILIGHSMGGLVARYFVEALEDGWQDTKAVITFGTPFYGSLNALDYLVNGLRKGLGPVRVDVSDVLRSCTSVHQLMPAYRCVYGADGTARLPADAGLERIQPKWTNAWSDHSQSFHRELEAATKQNRDDPGYPANPVVYQPLTGRDQPTLQSAVVGENKLELLRTRAKQDESGDGTVPLISAALSGTQAMRMFAPEKHSRLQANSPMLDHMCGVVQGLFTTEIEDLRDTVTSWFALSLDDVVPSGEPPVVELQALSSLDQDLVQAVDAHIVVTSEATGEEVVGRDVELARTPRRIELPPQPAGTYRIEVRGPADSAHVSDVFAVASEEETHGE